MPAAGWTKLSDEERRLAHNWYDAGETPAEIAERLSRNKSAMTRLLCKQAPRKPRGRPPLLAKAQVDLLQRRLHELIVKGNGEKTVAVADLKRAAKCKACTRSILDALHARNIHFRKLREKPMLTAEDVKARLCFQVPAQKQGLVAATGACLYRWQVVPGIFKGAERARAEQHSTYGAYSHPGKGLSTGYVKPKAGSLQHNTGVKGMLLHMGTGVTVHEVKGRWNGQAASKLCRTTW